MTVLRVLLADDHEVVRLGLRLLLEQLPDVEVVAEAGSGQEAVDLTCIYKPDVVILDIRMPPGRSGIEACKEISQRCPDTKVIMLTSYADDMLIAEAIQAGAVGYILKQVGTDELIRALDAVRNGQALLDPNITQRVLAMMRQQGSVQPDPFKDLTRREVDILLRVSEGKSNREIADELYLSDKTVRNNISVILNKLQVTNRVEAATYAVEHNIHTYSDYHNKQ